MDYEKKLNSIFLHFGINFEENPSLKDCHLCSSQLQFRARDLLILFYYIEETFKILIPQDVILNKEFTSYTKILDFLNQYYLK